jgi:hypothetical protein
MRKGRIGDAFVRKDSSRFPARRMIDGIQAMILLRFIGSRRAKNISGITLETRHPPSCRARDCPGFAEPVAGWDDERSFKYAKLKAPCFKLSPADMANDLFLRAFRGHARAGDLDCRAADQRPKRCYPRLADQQKIRAERTLGFCVKNRNRRVNATMAHAPVLSCMRTCSFSSTFQFAQLIVPNHPILYLIISRNTL